MRLNKGWLSNIVGVGLFLIAPAALPISRVGNNSFHDPVDRISAESPKDFPVIVENEDHSVTLKSPQAESQPTGVVVPAEIRVYSFHEKYPDLRAQSLDQIRDYFLAAKGTHYQVVSQDHDKLLLLGEGFGLRVGIFVANPGRGFIFLARESAISTENLKALLRKVVAQ